jgi:hypothetical protein
MAQVVRRSSGVGAAGLAALAGAVFACSPSRPEQMADRVPPPGGTSVTRAANDRRTGVVGDTFDLVAIGYRRIAATPPGPSCTGRDYMPQSERMIVRSDSVVVFQLVERAPCRGKQFSPGDTLFEVTGVYDLRGDTLSFYTVGGQEFERDLRLSGRLTTDSLLPFSADTLSARVYERRPRRAPHR